MDEILRVPDINRLNRDFAETARRRNNPASDIRDRLLVIIKKFEQLVGPDSELGIDVIGGSTPPFHLRGIQSSDPDILVFTGKDSESNPVALVQHHSQLTMTLTVVPKLEEEPYRIGFIHGG